MARPKIEEEHLIIVRNDIIYQLYKEGYTISEISRIFNLPRNTVYTVTKKIDKVKNSRTDYYREYKSKRYKENIQFKLSAILRSRINKFVLKNTKSGSSIRDLGCTVQELKKHIESKFKEGMSWDNWAVKGWHIDHIKPISKFDLTKRGEFLKACNYKNLQPMWAKENIIKSNKQKWTD